MPLIPERVSLRPEGSLPEGRQPALYAARAAAYRQVGRLIGPGTRRPWTTTTSSSPSPTSVPFRPMRSSPKPTDLRLADCAGGRPRGRGDLHRQSRTGEGAVLLGPAGAEEREQLLLGQGLHLLGGEELGGDSDPPDRARGDRGVSGGRPRFADHHRPGIQRRAGAAVCAAGQSDPERVKVPELQGWGTEDFNEIRFEDKKGSEEVYLHAQKDKKEIVENNNGEDIGNNESISVGNDQSLSVGNNRSKSVGKNETTSVGGNRTESVDKDESITITGSRSESVGKDESVSVTKNQSLDIGENRTETVGKNEELSVGENRTHNVGKNDALTVGKSMVIDVADQITIKTGDASITLKKNGDIQIKGKEIKVVGSGKIGIKADSDVNIKGSKVTNN